MDLKRPLSNPCARITFRSPSMTVTLTATAGVARRAVLSAAGSNFGGATDAGAYQVRLGKNPWQ